MLAAAVAMLVKTVKNVRDGIGENKSLYEKGMIFLCDNNDDDGKEEDDEEEEEEGEEKQEDA